MAYNNYGFNNKPNYKQGFGGGKPAKVYLPYVELTDGNYVEQAEKVINHIFEKQREYSEEFKNLKHKKSKTDDVIITTSQIRNLLSLNSEIYNKVIAENSKELSPVITSKLQYLKVRMVYDSGRQFSVNVFVQNSHLIKHIDNIGKDKKKYMTFARYMEALVAYRKFIGVQKGNDDKN